jgi:hypothetical protein
MNIFAWTGSIFALLIYFPLWWQIYKGAVKQNYLTWILWAILDVIVAATIIVQDGNYLLPVTYAIGSFVTFCLILRVGDKASWSWFETTIVFLVFASIFIWHSSGSKIATIASTSAMLIAGIPQLVDAFKRPREMPMAPYFGYFVANCLSVAGGKKWSIEERFYPTGAAILCLLIALLAVRKYFIRQPLPPILQA